MTTIAYCKGKLVSDSQSTVGGRRRIGAAKKIFTPEQGEKWKLLGRTVAAFALAGRAGAIEMVKQALIEGVSHIQPIKAKDVGFTTIVVCENGDVFFWVCDKDSKTNKDTHEIVPVTGPIAIGSGSAMAEAFMANGYGPKKAVKAACVLDTSSSGPLQVFKLPKKGKH